MNARTDNTLPILAWDQAYNRNGDRNLPRTVVNVIRTYVDNKTLRGWVKQETLAEATGLDVRSVKRQIRLNVDAGWLRITERGNSSGWANTYELTTPEMVTQMSPSMERVTPASPRGGHVRPLKGDTDVTPTTPITTHRTTKRTTPKKGDIDVPIDSSAEPTDEVPVFETLTEDGFTPSPVEPSTVPTTSGTSANSSAGTDRVSTEWGSSADPWAGTASTPTKCTCRGQKDPWCGAHTKRI